MVNRLYHSATHLPDIARTSYEIYNLNQNLDLDFVDVYRGDTPGLRSGTKPLFGRGFRQARGLRTQSQPCSRGAPLEPSAYPLQTARPLATGEAVPSTGSHLVPQDDTHDGRRRCDLRSPAAARYGRGRTRYFVQL